MRDTLLAYFAGEKHAGLMVGALGLCGLLAAAILYQPRWELRSFAVTLAVFALAELAIGVGLYLRTGPQVERLLAQLAADAGRLFGDESARMTRVQRNFVFLEYGWLVAIAAAAIVAVAQKGRFFVSG